MIWPFQKKPAPRAVKARPVGILSTQLFDSELDRELMVDKAMRSSFQVPLPQGRTATGMDSANDQTGVKARYDQGRSFMPEIEIAWYGAQGFIGYQLCAVIGQHWLVDRACSTPARDAARVGYDINVADGQNVAPEKLDHLRRMDGALKLRKHCEEFVRLGRMMGMRHALFMVDAKDPQYYEKPFNIDAVTKNSYRGISQIDPMWMVPGFRDMAIANPAAPDFYDPTFWMVQGQKIHKSHFVIFRGAEVPDILKPTYNYGGVSVTQRIYERVYAAERTANEAPILAMTKRLTNMKLDLISGIADEAALDEKIEKLTVFRDNHGVNVMGLDEEVSQIETSLTGLAETIESQYVIACAIAECPVTKIMGTSAKGMNATGEGDDENYRVLLESIQTHDLTDLVNRHHALCIRSEVSPDAPFATAIRWKPMDSPKATEQADINLKKAQTGQALVDSGAIDSIEERNRLIADPDSGYTGIDQEREGDELDDEIDVDFDTLGVGDPTEKTFSQISLTGPQIMQLQTILSDVSAKKMAPDTAKALIGVSFPMKPEQIDKLVDPMAAFEQPEPPPGLAGPDGAEDPAETEPPAAGTEVTDAMDVNGFDPATGTYQGATLITNQTDFLDQNIVLQKIVLRDFTVQVTPEFVSNGTTYRVIIDGHHSLAAASIAGQPPLFTESGFAGSDYRNALTYGTVFDSKDLKWKKAR